MQPSTERAPVVAVAGVTGPVPERLLSLALRDAGADEVAHTDPMNTGLDSIWLPALVLLPCLGIWIYSIVDFSRTNEGDMRTFSRDIWLVVLILGSVAGAIAWLLGGRPRRPESAGRP
jgi:hypothetical protein